MWIGVYGDGDGKSFLYIYFESIAKVYEIRVEYNDAEQLYLILDF